jgi:hypothetical protein
MRRFAASLFMLFLRFRLGFAGAQNGTENEKGLTFSITHAF